MATATDKTRAAILAARARVETDWLDEAHGGGGHECAVLAIDPDKTHPGAACWSSRRNTVYVWGGDKAGELLVNPEHVQGLLLQVAPAILVIEGPLAKGWASALECIAVRGGWQWLAALAGVPSIVVSPTVWQYAQHGPLKGAGAYKKAYKAHAVKLCGVPRVNEDRAAALGLLEFAVSALGHELPTSIQLGVP
jgi:hypothetical protein